VHMSPYHFRASLQAKHRRCPPHKFSWFGGAGIDEGAKRFTYWAARTGADRRDLAVGRISGRRVHFHDGRFGGITGDYTGAPYRRQRGPGAAPQPCFPHEDKEMMDKRCFEVDISPARDGRPRAIPTMARLPVYGKAGIVAGSVRSGDGRAAPW